MTFNVLTIFPGMFFGFLGETMMKRGIEAGTVQVKLVDIREHAMDKHKTTDDTPYGGGPGMVMKIQPIFQALASLGLTNEKGNGHPTSPRLRGAGRAVGSRSKVQSSRVVLLSPRGRQFTQQIAEDYSKLENLTLICGRYEGVDYRVAEHLCDEELSIGPYVLSGGEAAAMVMMEAVARLVPGFLGNPESLKEESFSLGRGQGAGGRSAEYPQYTKPEEFTGWKVPDVLLSGNHAKIEEWRKKQTKKSK